ncbi:MAG: hypothetical protein JSU85_13120 [Candidatus Zixiibacteriota bacterium]|nr:MAG: hypothetical protein JSU85_13120 [candidate division Zixibacteria bacterium]
MAPRILSLSIIAILIPISAKAVIIHVPDDCPTIQAAVDSCSGGDTVMVAPGIYSGDGNRNISIVGKSIAVISADGPISTIIDGGVIEIGFNIIAGGESSSLIQGFTIRNVYIGIYCDSSSVIVKKVIIEDFLSRGIHFDGFLYDPPLTADIEECVVHQIQPSYQGVGLGFRGARSVDVSIYGSVFSDCLYGMDFHTLDNRVPEFDIEKCVLRNSLLDGIWTHS